MYCCDKCIWRQEAPTHWPIQGDANIVWQRQVLNAAFNRSCARVATQHDVSAVWGTAWAATRATERRSTISYENARQHCKSLHSGLVSILQALFASPRIQIDIRQWHQSNRSWLSKTIYNTHTHAFGNSWILLQKWFLWWCNQVLPTHGFESRCRPTCIPKDWLLIPVAWQVAWSIKELFKIWTSWQQWRVELQANGSVLPLAAWPHQGNWVL